MIPFFSAPSRINPFSKNEPLYMRMFRKAGGYPGLAGAAAGGLSGYTAGDALQKKYMPGYSGHLIPVIMGLAGTAGGMTAVKYLSGIDKKSSSAFLLAAAGHAYLSSKKDRFSITSG